MKILFFLALLSNIVFFLWEFNSGVPVADSKPNLEKQILLVSELPDNKQIEVDREQPENKEIIIAKVQLDQNCTNDDCAPQLLIESLLAIDNGESIVNKEGALIDELIDDVLVDIDFVLIQVDAKNIEPGNQQETEIVVNNKLEQAKLNSNEESLETKLCFQVGPFKDRDTIKTWNQNNSIEGDFEIVEEDRQVVDKYLVYFPAAEGFQQSKTNAQQFKKQGINDLWLFRKGELKGVISFGLFVEESRALNLQKKMMSMSINAQIKQRYKTDFIYFLRVETEEKGLKEAMKVTEGQTILDCEKP